ncbi:hypothetical protein CHU98_g9049 [Xylaria longipes]|nr:hypothetical protein CHU98_g9049 [Xylaria longipes]
MLGRILVAWTVIVFASVAFAADPPNVSNVNPDDIPQCGLLCIVNTVTEKSSCAVTDFPCICANAALNKEIEACFTTECSPRDALSRNLRTMSLRKSVILMCLGISGGKNREGLMWCPEKKQYERTPGVVAFCLEILGSTTPIYRKLAVWLVPLISVIFSTIFYLLRLVSRAVLRQRIDVADLILGVSVGFTFPVLWVAFTLGGLGLGQDVWEIPQDNITQILYLYWWAEILYQAGLPLARISILCFYLRVFPQDRIRWASFALIGLNIADLLAFVLSTVFQCSPIYGAWTFWDGSFQGHCNNLHIQSWIQAGFNIALDLVVIILPLPPLAKLTASKRKKIQIMIMFSLGFLIIRLKTLVVFANSTNISYDYVDPGLYSIIEASISIIICCLPATRALLSVIMPNLFPSTTNRSFSSGESPKNNSSNQRFNRLEEAYNSSDEATSPIGAKEEWSVHGSTVSTSESNVELMPVTFEGAGLNMRNGQEGKDAEPTRIMNWSRPLPRGRESSLTIVKVPFTVDLHMYINIIVKLAEAPGCTFFYRDLRKQQQLVFAGCKGSHVHGNMCGIHATLTTSPQPELTSELKQSLINRGPDHFGQAQRELACTISGRRLSLYFTSTVLALRGDHVAKQPLEEGADTGSVLCWNGEAWRINGQPVCGNDGEAVFSMLQSSASLPGQARETHVVEVLRSIEGPFAFVYYDSAANWVYYGRDRLGRRSLLIKPSSETGSITLSSIASVPTSGWEEVSSDGIWSIGLGAYDARMRCIGVFNRQLPPPKHELDFSSPSLQILRHKLIESLKPRVLDVPEPPNMISDVDARIAILFSGGLDCTVLARLTHELVPLSQGLDLINVAFENPRQVALEAKQPHLRASDTYEGCPDRATGRKAFAELKSSCPGRYWRFIAVNVPFEEAMAHKKRVLSLIYPHDTEMDLSIAFALYFAARGTGDCYVDRIEWQSSPTAISTSARVLLSGLGADELFGGYSRHEAAFKRSGYSGLIDELRLDVSRIGQRNLGRDDRIMAHWGREVRFPYLDEEFVKFAITSPVWEKCDFENTFHPAVIDPAKRILRLLADQLNLPIAARQKKKAIQFGSRTAKIESTTGRLRVLVIMNTYPGT